ncbi:Mycorrhiza-upregulated peptidase C14 [Mycena venus]|uniref:Mycorrhiza-upregulated peptidase C14 n=1 Tax=Mycena venus TaxID=2733690 RepID=A0A8H6YG14_9AGAR|nr:Mycorrhiza-upregulated peptidase C14 [Mycena venus]
MIISVGGDQPDTYNVSYDIGWMLDAVTTKDLHALVIDFAPRKRALLAKYLTRDLAVPRNQVTHLRGPDATHITGALQSLEKNTDIRRGSSIIIYISWPSDEPSTPTRIGNPTTGLEYSTFFSLVQQISAQKGENVTVILDTNPPPMDTNAEATSNQQPHVLLTACLPKQYAQYDVNGGVFTQALIRSMKTCNAEELERLTWDRIVDKSADALATQKGIRPQIPECTGTFKNRAIFNGIFGGKVNRPQKERENCLISISVKPSST